MEDRNEQFTNKWDMIRSKGRMRYAVVNGGLFGLVIYVIVSLLKLGEYSFEEIFFTPNALREAASWVFGGMLSYGTIVWWMNEKAYKRIKNQ